MKLATATTVSRVDRFARTLRSRVHLVTRTMRIAPALHVGKSTSHPSPSQGAPMWLLPCGTRSEGRRRMGFMADFENWYEGKVKIGSDKDGNTYWEVPNPGGTPDPKREVQFKSSALVWTRPHRTVRRVREDFDMETVPPEWHMWVKNVRQDPPTEEEIELAALKRAVTLQKALEIEREVKAQKESRVLDRAAEKRQLSEFNPRSWYEQQNVQNPASSEASKPSPSKQSDSRAQPLEKLPPWKVKK